MTKASFKTKTAGYAGGKRYILLFQREQLNNEPEGKLLSKAIQIALPKHTPIRVEELTNGFKALRVKNIDVVVIHQSLFKTESELVELAKALKEIKKVTVIFITRNERALIEAYRENLSLYEELDDYLTAPLDPAELVKKLKKAGSIDARAAKRFLIKIPVEVSRIDTLQSHSAVLDDLSLVGCSLTFESDLQFRRDEQLRVRIPLFSMGIFHPQYGDFLKLALKVRRLSIRGQTLGCSIEYLTPMQNGCLVTFLEDVSRKQRSANLKTNEKRGAYLNEK